MGKNVFKVLIIDDEVLIAKGLETKIDWKKLECEVCGVAANGLEGKSLIEEQKPDIVISDIVMPGLTGLELSKHIHSCYPSIITIILTAHDDFKFAQKAIKYGVKEYILKPIDKNEIIRAVKKAVVIHKANQSHVSDINRLQGMVTEVKPIMTSTILLNIALNGDTEIEALGGKLQYFDINLGKVIPVVFEFEPEREKETDKLHGFVLKNAIQSMFEKHRLRCDFKEKDSLFISLIHFDEGIVNSIIYSRLKEIGGEIRKTASDSTGLLVSAGLGRVCKSIYEIHPSYLDAQNALERRFFESSPGIFDMQDCNSRNSGKNETKEYVDLSGLFQNINERKAGQALEMLRVLMDDLRETGDRRQILATASDIVRQLNSLVYAVCGPHSSTRFVLDNPADVYSFLNLKRYLENAIKKTCEELLLQPGNTGNRIIDRVERMIRERYRDKELSLQSVADELNLSLSYVSRLFKKEKDLNFMEYLTNVRINEARKLLRGTDMKNNEIADRIGFYDVGYFSQVFRKKCGMTPSEYRQWVSGQKIK